MKNKVGDNISMVTSGWSFNDIEKRNLYDAISEMDDPV